MSAAELRAPWPPRCATCRHWLPDAPSYPACAIVNHKPDAGALAFMPADADDGCFRHADKMEAPDGDRE